MAKWKLVFLFLAVVGLSVGCSDSSNDGGMDAGGDGDGDSGDGDGDGDASGDGDGDGDSMCDESIVAAATCGSETCPEPDMEDPFGLGRNRCVVSCCTADDVCGTRRATEGGVGACEVPAQADDRCKSVSGGPFSFPGCCTADNECGVIFGSMCTSNADAIVFAQGALTEDDIVDCDGNSLVEPDDDAGM